MLTDSRFLITDSCNTKTNLDYHQYTLYCVNIVDKSSFEIHFQTVTDITRRK